jgi:hypothetical protein
MLGMIFMTLKFMDHEELKKLQEEKPLLIYEYLSEAGPRSINGYPNFFSFKYLIQEEYDIFIKHYKEIQESMKKLEDNIEEKEYYQRK